MGGAEAVYRFRPRRGIIPLVFVCGLPFALFAAYAPWAAGPRHPGWWLGLVMAGAAAFCCAIGSALLLTTAVTVGPTGLTKAPRWNWGFAVAWPRVESWSVGLPPAWHDAPADTRVVRFRVAGWRREAVVFDSEVGHPGFAAFVTALRAVAGDREAVAPNQALQQTGAACRLSATHGSLVRPRLLSWVVRPLVAAAMGRTTKLSGGGP